MPLKRLGLFKELNPGLPNIPSLVEAKGGLREEDRSRSAAYLRQASVLSASSGFVDDWFTGEKKVARLYSQTDGVWVWPEVLSYYVLKHGVALPQDFLEHMQAQGWHCPVLTREQLIAASEEFFKGMKSG